MQSFFQTKSLCTKAAGFAIKNISFSLKKSDYLVIVGPTGCGKTMLLETLAGLRQPSNGSIFFDNTDITNFYPEQRNLGFAYQDSLLYPFLNVRDNILFGAKAKHKDKDPAVLNHLSLLTKRMGIEHLLSRFPRDLSGGEKQRISLARAIITFPKILLLDEPLSALDPNTKDNIKQLLSELHSSENLTIIHVTHDFNEALQLGNKLIVMNKGKILQQGSPSEIFKAPRSLFIAGFLQNKNLREGYIKNISGQFYFFDTLNNWSIGPLPDTLLPQQQQTKVHLLLASGQISIHKQSQPDCRDITSWPAAITKVIDYNSYLEITCQGQGCWTIVISPQQWQHLSLLSGDKVRLSACADKAHLIWDN